MYNCLRLRVILACLLTIMPAVSAAQVSGSPGVTGAPPSGSFAGYPNAVTVGGQSSIYTGANLCAALTAAFTSNVTGGFFNATGFQGDQVCSAASMTSLSSAIAGLTGQAVLQLGCPLNWYVPLQSSIAGTAGQYPLGGMIVTPPGFKINGCGVAGSPSGSPTRIIVCTGTNTPRAGCTAPATHEFAITSTPITTAGVRTFMQVNVTGTLDIVAAEPVRITGLTNTALNGAYRVCQNGSATVAAYVDSSCPGIPTSSLLYVPVNSGIVTAVVTPGSGYLVPVASVTANHCAVDPTFQLSGATAALVTIQSRGSGCGATPPTITISDNGSGAPGTGASMVVTTATGCASSCGANAVLHGSIPILETGPQTTSNTFNQVFSNITLDCNFVPDCVGLRSLGGNEESDVYNIFITGLGCAAPCGPGVNAGAERGFDFHTNHMQDANVFRGIRVTPGVTANCDIGTEGGYIGDVGPHGLSEFTADFTNCTGFINWGLRVDTSVFFYLFGGHSEKSLYGIMLGDAAPTRNFHVDSWLGAPQSSIVQTAGSYQNENSSAVKIRSEYWATSGINASTDYIAINVGRNNTSTSTATIADDNPVGVNGSAGPWLEDAVTSLYAVDLGVNGCITAISTSSWGDNPGCKSLIFGTRSASSAANISSTTLANATQTLAIQNGLNYHFYALQYEISLTSVGTSCTGSTTVTPTFTWTDPNNTTGGNKSLAAITIATTGNGTVGWITSGVQYLLVKAGTPISYSTTYSIGAACAPGPSYQFSPTLVQIY